MGQKELQDFLKYVEEELAKVQLQYDAQDWGSDKRAAGARLDNLLSLKLKIWDRLNSFITPEQEELAKELFARLDKDETKSED